MLVVLQVGYFVLVVRLIFSRAHEVTSRDELDSVPPLHRDGIWL